MEDDSRKCAKCGGDVVTSCEMIDTLEIDGDDQKRLGIEWDSVDATVRIGDGVSVGVHFCRQCYAIECAWVEDFPGMVREKDPRDDRLDYLNRWLESRGLPLTWKGKMTAARFIAIEERVINPDSADAYCESYITGAYIGEEYRWAGDIRWDRATSEQRAEALKIDAAKEAK